MRRLVPLLLLAAAACPPPTDPPPPIPTRVDQPPPTPTVDTCELDATTLPFSASWTPVTFAPEVDDPAPTLQVGTVTVPSAWGLTLTTLEVHGEPATVTDLVDDGTSTTATWEATASCEGRCTWTEATIGEVRLTSPTTDLTVASTALVALDLSYAPAAARNGATGLEEGDRPTLDALVPTVVTAILDQHALDQTTGVRVGGAPLPGTTVFDAIDAGLADATLPAPAVDTDLTWSLQTLAAVPDARLVVLDGLRVSLPVAADPEGFVSWHTLSAGPPGERLVFRWVLEDGRQSPATVATWTEGPSSITPTVTSGEGETVVVGGLPSDTWVLQRSNTTAGRQGACRVDEAADVVLAIDPTTSFTIVTLDDDLAITSLQGCDPSDEPLDCVVP